MNQVQNYISPITNKIAQYIPDTVKSTVGSMGATTVQFFQSGSLAAITSQAAINFTNCHLLGKLAVAYRNSIFINGKLQLCELNKKHKFIALTAGVAQFAFSELFNNLTGFKNPYLNNRYLSLIYSGFATCYVWSMLSSTMNINTKKSSTSSSPAPTTPPTSTSSSNSSTYPVDNKGHIDGNKEVKEEIEEKTPSSTSTTSTDPLTSSSTSSVEDNSVADIEDVEEEVKVRKDATSPTIDQPIFHDTDENQSVPEDLHAQTKENLEITNAALVKEGK